MVKRRSDTLHEYLNDWHHSRPLEEQWGVDKVMLAALKVYADTLEEDIAAATLEGREVSVQYLAARYGLVVHLVTDLEMAVEDGRAREALRH